MTLRITLLVLATGFFALIWTHDRPAAEPGISRSADLAQTVKSSGLEFLSRPVSQIQTVIPMPEVPQDDAWMYGDCEMPLPEGIVPGEYRAVSNTGIVREFHLTLDDLKTYRGTKSEFVTRDIYESQTESLRWYFIRVQAESSDILPVIAERGGHVILPAVAEQSATKERNQQASRIIVSAGQNLALRLIRMVRNESPARISTEIKDRIRL